MKTVIKLKNTRLENTLTAIEKACKIAGVSFDYKIGYRVGHQATHITVWVNGIKRTNMKFYHPLHGVGIANTSLLKKVAKLLNNKVSFETNLLGKIC